MHGYLAPTEMLYCLCHWNTELYKLKLLCFKWSLQKVIKCLDVHVHEEHMPQLAVFQLGLVSGCGTH